MTRVFFVALFFAARKYGPPGFRTAHDAEQPACEDAAKHESEYILRVEYAVDAAETCCEKSYASFGFRDTCKATPGEWGCARPAHGVAVLRCVSAPAYKAVPL